MLKEEIEAISGELKIRKGFEKFIDKAIIYLKIDEDSINKETSDILIKFINSCNSKYSESYYILRTDLKKEDYIDKLNADKNNFFNQSYKNKSRKEVSKNINDSFYCRGYSGWCNINNNKYYLRSKQEFIYLNYLIWKFPESVFKTEEKVFEFDNEVYKPDIFEYINGKLVNIYEVKHEKAAFENEKYVKFEEYSKTIGLNYIKLYQGKEILKNNDFIKPLLSEWINDIKRIQGIDFSGNNPMKGRHHKESTKKLISKKAKERQTEEYRKKISDAVRKNYKEHPEIKEKISQSRKDWGKKKRELLDIQNPYEERICEICGGIFSIRKNSLKTTCTTNGSSCTWKLSLKLNKFKAGPPEGSMKIAYKERLIKYSSSLEFSNIDEYLTEVKKFKDSGLIPIHFGMGLNVIEKYFENFEIFLNKIKGKNENL